MLANVGHYLRGLSDRVKVLPVARTGPLRVAAETVSAPVEAVPDSRLNCRNLTIGKDGECVHCYAIAGQQCQYEPSGDGWEDNAIYLLDRCPHAVRVREGGGPENLLSSLCVTFQKMQGMLATTPPQAEPSPGMSKSWQTAVAVAREAPSGRTVVDSAVILAIDKRLSEAFAAMPQDKRCEHCDSTGDVHDQTGEWRGECTACDAATVARLRAVCRLLTLETAVPNDDDATLMGCLFSVLGQIRRAIEHMRTQTANMQTLAENGAAEISKLTAELQEVRKDAWQPIGTAPKDGTEILLGYGGRVRPYGNGDYGDRAYVTARKFKPTQWGEGWGVEPFETPTHWRPLPAAPEATKP
jgi:hypothetical protein